MFLLLPSEPAQASSELQQCVTHRNEVTGEGGWRQTTQWAVYSCEQPATLAFCYRDIVMKSNAAEIDKKLALDMHCDNTRRFHDPCIFYGPGKCANASFQAWARRIKSATVWWAICERDGNVPEWKGADRYTCDGLGIEESEDSIRDMQNALSELGFDPGPADGLWGRRTETAAADYIRSRGGEMEPGNRRQIMVEVFSLRTSDERVMAEDPGKVVDGDQATGPGFRDCDSCPEMVVVPSGSFTMGSPASEEDRGGDEGPQHRVSINKFAVGKYEVTRGEYRRFVNETGHYTGNSCWVWESSRGWEERTGMNWESHGFSQTDGHPVVCVNWEDAKSYVEWLSRKTGHQYRLLSESEWEYAARAGTRGPFHFGSTISTDQANYNGDYTYGNGRKGVHHRKTMPVGSFPPNRFGLHDVHGNVWEWVEDCWHDSYAGAPNDGSAWTSGGDCRGRVGRVQRGGSWVNKPRDLRSAYRIGHGFGLRFDVNGFRVARTLTP